MKRIQTHTVVDHLFRNEYGKVIAVLTYRYGGNHLDAIEDATQEAFLKAMKVWGYRQIPDKPTAWLIKVANNKLIDYLRKQKKTHLATNEAFYEDNEYQKEPELNTILEDSQLKMIFACCHPSLSTTNQVILALKLIGGFNNKELADALLKKEETIAKAFTRAKKALKEVLRNRETEVLMALQSRLFVVFKVIYLLFSEGYSASSGKQIIKRDICYEAIRLALLLNKNTYARHPNLNALIALMCFHTSRFAARVDENGELIDLEHQDRNRYDKELISIGMSHLENAGTLNKMPSRYHLEAAVSYFHSAAATFKETLWPDILELYDIQLQKFYTPMVELNRIVAYKQVYGTKKAMKVLEAFEKGRNFVENSLYYAIKADLFQDNKRTKEAVICFSKAAELTKNEVEKRHFEKKIQRLKNASRTQF